MDLLRCRSWAISAGVLLSAWNHIWAKRTSSLDMQVPGMAAEAKVCTGLKRGHKARSTEPLMQLTRRRGEQVASRRGIGRKQENHDYFNG